jgi:RNA polymerase sigma-70 factor, ECF subfamily
MKAALDLACLQRARAGDPGAFRAVYEHCADVVFRFLSRMTGDAAAAEDAMQETFVRVLRALRGFDPAGPASLTTWVLTIARRVALSRELSVQRTRRREYASRMVLPELAVPAPEDAAQLRQALETAVAALPLEQRAVFVLRECQAMSYDEIAAIEGIDLGTVKSRLYRARLALQQRLRAQLDHDEEGSNGERRARA